MAMRVVRDNVARGVLPGLTFDPLGELIQPAHGAGSLAFGNLPIKPILLTRQTFNFLRILRDAVVLVFFRVIDLRFHVSPANLDGV